MMQGWPINTFRLISEQGVSTFARFVWKPRLGVHGLRLQEANIAGGVDPDYHRHDIIEAIEKGLPPEYEFGVQLISEEDEREFDFDLLDDTKLWPEEVVPVRIVGRMRLNRLVDNFFAEEEQSSFDPSTVVPGIDFSFDPVLQGRTFAYRDTDYHRLGTSNINDIPINRPIAQTNTNQRDGYSRYPIDTDPVDYHKNSLANTPSSSTVEEGAKGDYRAEISGHVTRKHPSAGFDDHFSQARMFWNSMSAPEREDLIETFTYHLGKVTSMDIRQQTVEMFGNVDTEMAATIAHAIGAEPPESTQVDIDAESPALSIMNTAHSAQSQRAGVLISERLAPVSGPSGAELAVDETFITSHPVLFDAYYIVGGNAEQQREFEGVRPACLSEPQAPRDRHSGPRVGLVRRLQEPQRRHRQ